jgi:transposase
VVGRGEALKHRIAKDFGLSVTTLKRWIALAEFGDSDEVPAPQGSARCGS